MPISSARADALQCNSGMFDVVVYTSMMGHNVEAGLNAVLPAYRSLLKSGCPILDRWGQVPQGPGAQASRHGHARRCIACVGASCASSHVVITHQCCLPIFYVGACGRSMNKPDPEGENEWDTVRDMDKASAVGLRVRLDTQIEWVAQLAASCGGHEGDSTLSSPPQ